MKGCGNCEYIDVQYDDEPCVFCNRKPSLSDKWKSRKIEKTGKE